MRSSAVIAGLAAGVIGVILILPIFDPRLGVYVSLVALGLALALQKYVASFAGHFVLRQAKLFDVGDRIRIGGIKGDVRQIGLLHFVLDEVGEGEKMGGELTGRILHIPNHLVLDQPVLNFSQNFALSGRFMSSNYMFDEVRLPLEHGANVTMAHQLLEEILREEDAPFVREAKLAFGADRPNFLQDIERSPRIMVYLDDKHIWLVGKFVAPVRGRNDLKTRINLRFLEGLSAFPRSKAA